MKNKKWTLKFIVLAVVCFLVGVGIGLIGYLYFLKPQVYEGLTQGNITKIEPTKEMVEKIVFYENGKQEVIDPKSEEGDGLASLLTRKLHELNLQAKCVFSEEDIQKIKQKDRVVELSFKKPVDITISQWVEPEERYHIPTDEKGYRILENVKNALFILEDNLDGGLEARILVGHLIPPEPGLYPSEERIGYSCWAISKDGEIDKSWIKEVEKMRKINIS